MLEVVLTTTEDVLTTAELVLTADVSMLGRVVEDLENEITSEVVATELVVMTELLAMPYVLEMVGVLAGTVLDAEPQLKPMEWMLIEHPPESPLRGLNVTLLAPPHCVFWMTEPSEEQEWDSVQVEPSGMPYSQSISVSLLEETW